MLENSFMKRIIHIFIKYIFSVVLLVSFWIGMGIVFNPYASITIITTPHPRTELTKWNDKELLKDNYIAGSFVASQDNLGIVAFRFNTYHRINNDYVIFRIKENGTKSWYYSNRYKVDQFQPDDLFTFGFPIIQTSKNKKFDFIIQSVAGEKNNAVAVSAVDPVFVTKYQFSKFLILHNVKYGINFLILKILSSVFDSNFYPFSFLFLIPLVIYLFHQVFPISVKVQKKVLFILISLLVFEYLCASDSFGIWVEFSIVTIWLILLISYNLNLRYAFLVAALLLFLTPLLLILGQGIIAERLAMISYLFVLLGVLGIFTYRK